jgi:peptide/nickel transport system permease protein
LEAPRTLVDRLALAHSLRLKGFFASTILIIVILSAFLGSVIWQVDPSFQQLSARLLPPLSVGSDGVYYMFGTDHLGRDLLARTLAGARISLLVALLAVGVAAVFGVGVGLASGFLGGRVDHAITTCVDVQLALPFTLLAISIATITGPSLVNVIVVLTATGWVAFARVVRSQVLSLRETDFVSAARGLGCGPGRLLVRHLLPNCASTIIVIASFAAARMIVAEATISFLGVGVPSWIPSWGSMISEGRTYLPVAWWVAIVPGGAITLSVIAINLLGDWLCDRLDPRLASPNGVSELRRTNGGRRPDGERA